MSRNAPATTLTNLGCSLGTGNSEHPTDAYNVVQAATDLAIAERMASMLRNGAIDGTSYSKIVGIGHSYGAVQMQALTATSPSALDAVILQGFSANTSFVAEYLTSTAYETATQIFPSRFSNDLSNAYLVTATPSTNQLNFFYFPYYSPDSFNLARVTEQPVTQGVLFTFGALPTPATTYSKPVLVATGDHDWIFCGNNCYAVPINSTKASILDYVQSLLYPAVTNFSTYIPANTGHAVNQRESRRHVVPLGADFWSRRLLGPRDVRGDDQVDSGESLEKVWCRRECESSFGEQESRCVVFRRRSSRFRPSAEQ